MQGSSSLNQFLIFTVYFVVISQLSIYSNLALAIDNNVENRYMDAGVSNVVVDGNHCFYAAPTSILEVSPNTSNEGQRIYNIKQVSNPDEQRKDYAKSIENQIKDHEFIATKFCHGFVSISNMQLPFSKSNTINDANDGILLVDEVDHGMTNILNHLYAMNSLAMSAAKDMNNPVDSKEFDDKFQLHLDQINIIANKTIFNGVFLLNGSHAYVDVPVRGGGSHEYINLVNATTGDAGLNIENLDLLTTAHASAAFTQLATVVHRVETHLQTVKNSNSILKKYAVLDAKTTVIDIRTDDFLVQSNATVIAKK